MKATGIVRRIDDLGRVVIPKEIRRTLRIREGDPLEIFTDREGEVILKKYSPINELNEFANEYVQSVYDVLGSMAVITDRDQVIAAIGKGKKEMLEKRISKDIEKIIQEKTAKLITEKERLINITAADGEEKDYQSQVVVPIVSQGDPIGSIIFMSLDSSRKLGDVDLKVAETGANFLAKQMEN